MQATTILERAQALQEQMVAWRRDIHMHPELGFQETRTSRLVVDTLRDLGLEVQTGIAKTGVIAYIGEGSPVVGIRADMDALPIHEANDVPYASQNPGVMHACGHDAHTAILLGVAHMLVGMDDRPPGQIRLLFQPCEETQDAEAKSGAMRMVEEGAMEGIDHVIALHMSSGMPAGKIEIIAGNSHAAVDTFTATIHGEGCHGASPHTGIDPIFVAAQVINAIHGVRARRIDPIQPALISIGSIHGGDASNVIPGKVGLVGTIRSYDDNIRQQLWRELDRALAVSRAFGGDYELDITEGYPPTVNDAEVAGTIRGVARDLLGEGALEPGEPTMGAEDFGYMSRKAPGAMFMLGAKYDDTNRPHHSPIFDIAETPFAAGAAVMVETAFRLLRGE